MIDDEKIIEMFFERSEQGIRELDIKYGKALSLIHIQMCIRDRFYPIKKAKEVTMSNTINVNYMTRACNQYQQKIVAKDCLLYTSRCV